MRERIEGRRVEKEGKTDRQKERKKDKKKEIKGKFIKYKSMEVDTKNETNMNTNESFLTSQI